VRIARHQLGCGSARSGERSASWIVRAIIAASVSAKWTRANDRIADFGGSRSLRHVFGAPNPSNLLLGLLR
jgi:hypothetical protein